MTLPTGPCVGEPSDTESVKHEWRCKERFATILSDKYPEEACCMMVAIDPLEKTPAENLYKTPVISNVLIPRYPILIPIMSATTWSWRA